jgi:hypothetical protein
LSSFEREINNSLVEVVCSGVYGVGFAGRYDLTQEFKDAGFNSLILTTATATSACRYFNSSIFVTYKGKRDNGLIRFWNGQTSDFASIQSRLTIPTLYLYGNDLPKKDWWVGVVQNVPGFGLVWAQSKITVVNKEKMIFAIDSIVPYVTDNALVFNNQGTFMGVLSSFGITMPQGQVVVQGAPLQCQSSKSNSSPTATNCGELATEVWKDSGTDETAPVVEESSEPESETEYDEFLSQTISYVRLKKSYSLGSKSVILNAQSDSGLQVDVASKNNSICSASIKKKLESFHIKLLKPGVCNLTLSQDGDSDYYLAEPKSILFRITK